MPLINPASACLSLGLLLAAAAAGATPMGPAATAPGVAAVTHSAAAPAAPAPAVAASSPSRPSKKSSHVVVIEDDNVRIEEARSRGRVQSIHVQHKIGHIKGYDIQVAPAGRDPSQERGNAGQRTWSLFSF
jgi:hypothetical protein